MSEFEIIRGQSVRWASTATDDQDAAIDLTGASIEVLEHTIGHTVSIESQIVTPATGDFEITIDGDETIKAIAGTRWLRARINLSGGDEIAFIFEDITVR